ncbi:MAG: MinD/ParA family protein [Clostridia bacterium]|nr:MinD/ParA family protein [Clostridia bacterium]
MRDQAEKLRILARAIKSQVEADIKNGFSGSSPENELAEQPAAAKTRIFAVTSGKGGVGKTNFTINLALALMKLGQRVMVLDADLGLANVDVVLGLKTEHNLSHLINGEKNIKDIISLGPNGLQVLAGGSGMQELANLSRKRVQKFINSLSELEGMTDILIIDTGAGLARNVMSFVLAADEVIVICTPEPTAMTDAYGLVKTLYKQKPESKVHLVVNRVENAEEANETANKFTVVAQKFLQFPVATLGYVLDDPSVSKAVKTQEPFFLKYPKSNAAQCLERLASQLLNNNSGIQEPPAGVRGFLTKMIRFFS